MQYSILFPKRHLKLTKCFFLSGHWDEQFHREMVDNRGFMVSRSYTVSVQMMHRTGRWRHSCQLVQRHSLRLGTVENLGKI